LVRFSHDKISPEFRCKSQDDCGGWSKNVEEQIQEVLVKYYSLSDVDQAAFVADFVAGMPALIIYIPPVGTRARLRCHHRILSVSLDGLIITLSNRRLCVLRSLAYLGIIDKVKVELHRFESATIQHTGYDEKLQCRVPKWESSFSSRSDGRYVNFWDAHPKRKLWLSTLVKSHCKVCQGLYQQSQAIASVYRRMKQSHVEAI